MPKTPETIGMISDDQFALMKPTAFVVNVARGGLIDEDALHRALTSNTIAGAGLDVFVSEPPKDSPLVSLPNVVVTPHLGASTDEAQEKAGVSVAKSVRLALGGELVPDAVNVAGGVIDPYVRPGIPLVEKLGQVFTALATSPVTSIDVEVHGELAEYDVSVLKLAALRASSPTSSATRSPTSTPRSSRSSAASPSGSSRTPTARSTATSSPSAGPSPTARRSASPAPSPARSRSRRSSRSTATTSRCRSPSTTS